MGFLGAISSLIPCLDGCSSGKGSGISTTWFSCSFGWTKGMTSGSVWVQCLLFSWEEWMHHRGDGDQVFATPTANLESLQLEPSSLVLVFGMFCSIYGCECLLLGVSNWLSTCMNEPECQASGREREKKKGHQKPNSLPWHMVKLRALIICDLIRL